MGGKALSTPTRRISRSEFNMIESSVQDFLNERDVPFQSIPFYRKKDSFGDFDIVVSDSIQDRELLASEGTFGSLKKDLAEVFHSRSFFVNSNVCSFEFRHSPEEEEGFQVDFICFPENDMQAAADYFSYNDLGNLIGRVAHKMGLSYGQKGLLFPMRDGNRLLATPVISSSADEALDVLGYDAHRFREGFDTVEDIFDFATSTPYFSPEIYLLENRNSIARKRDKNRPNYRGFLEYLERGNFKSFEFPEKSSWLPKLFERFPDFKKEHDSVLHLASMRKSIKDLYNGILVSGWTGLDGRELGSFMQQYRKGFQDEAEFLAHLQEINVESDVKNAFSRFKNSFKQKF